MANPVVMDDAQFQQLLGQVGGAEAGPRAPAVKLPVLEKTDATEYLTWEHLIRIGVAGLPDDDAVRRRHIALAVQGAAARATQHISWNDAANVDALLTAYRTVFVTQAASNLALITFEQAEQSEQETVLQWHSRLRVLYLQAYPPPDAAAVAAAQAAGQPLPGAEESRTLIQRFVRGLADPVVCQQVWRVNPGNYSAALTAAQNEIAALGMIQHKTGSVAIRPLRVKEEININAVGTGPTCWGCGAPGHIQRECRSAARGGNRTNRGGTGRRGRGGGRGPATPARKTNLTPTGSRRKGFARDGVHCVDPPVSAPPETSEEGNGASRA